MPELEEEANAEQLQPLTVVVPSSAASVPLSGDVDLSAVANRPRLFYDEDIDIFFQVPIGTPERARIDITVNVVGHSAPTGGQGPEQPRVHSIASQSLDSRHIAYTGSKHGTIWTTTLPVRHPRSRILRPKIIVDARLSLTGAPAGVTTTTIEMADLAPINANNLFDPLVFAGLGDRKGFSPDHKASDGKQAPDGKSAENTDVFTAGAVRLEHSFAEFSPVASGELELPVFPALNLRLRCAKLTGGGENDNLIASIEITSGETAKVSVYIREMHLDLADGTVTPLGSIDFPCWLHFGESIVLSYSVNAAEMPASTTSSRIGPVTILVECFPAEVALSPQEIPDIEAFCRDRPAVKTKWETSVDFDVTPNPQTNAFVHTPTLLSGGIPSIDAVPIRRVARPLSRNNSTVSVTSTAQRRPTLSGLSLSFSGPSTVKVGDKFQWKVFALNRSSSARSLSLFLQSRESPHLERGTIAKNTELYPVIDRAVLRRAAALRAIGDKGIVSLMNDVRLGPMQPQTCFETEINLLALSPGIHTLGDITLVDMTNGQGYDCGRLLEVVVTK